MPWIYLTIPFIIQTIVILIDEFYFHVKRSLPRWERIGHPLDTLTVLACFLYSLFIPFSSVTLKGFIGFALFSCLFITKDEWVHKHHCPTSELWLHAILFVNHSIMLIVTGLIWPIIQKTADLPSYFSSWTPHAIVLTKFMYLQSFFICIFLLYQIFYWNYLWKRKKSS